MGSLRQVRAFRAIDHRWYLSVDHKESSAKARRLAYGPFDAPRSVQHFMRTHLLLTNAEVSWNVGEMAPIPANLISPDQVAQRQARSSLDVEVKSSRLTEPPPSPTPSGKASRRRCF